MITFLRKIRKSLIASGSSKKNASPFGRYILYAFGEILLVMVGILLALQVNNWNEERKEHIQQMDMLFSLHNSLDKSATNLIEVIATNKKTVASYEIILDHIESDLPYVDSLGLHFVLFTHWASPFLDLSAYQTLKNRGAEFVENKNLRISIIEIFEQDFGSYVNEYDRVEWEFAGSVVKPYFMKHFITISFKPRIARPNNYEKLKLQEEFKNILTYLIGVRSHGIERGEILLDKIEKVNTAISKELNKA